MRLSLFLLFISWSFVLTYSPSAQNVTDDFSDGDLLNPDWQGDVANFIVDNEELRLMAPAAGSSTIWLPLRTATQEEIVYEFFVRLDFAPSGGNFGEMELRGLSTDNEAVVYKLRIGGISGDQDALTFSVSYDGITSEELIAATPGAVGGDPAIARVRLTRSADNIWSLEADYTGGTTYQVEGTANDPREEPAQLDYFGFNCTYTSTRVDAFYFDDINVGPIDPDLEAPLFLGTQVLADDRIQLSFNEVLTANPAGNVSNYTISPSTLMLSDVNLDGANVELVFANNLPVGEDITIEINGVTDNFGNSGGPFSVTIFIEPTTMPRPDNLLITEFMADPSPVVGLPNAEYVEIFNASDTLMLIEGLTLASGGTPQTVNLMQLPPRSYVTIVDDEAVGEFPVEAQVVTVASFPALTNGGDEIELAFNGNLIQRIIYTDDWYNDPTRAEGGYSLELTDLTANDLNCQGRWAASQASAGGTPGLANSVDGLIVDEQGPQALGGVFIAGGIELRFNEELSTGQDIGAFSISPDLGVVGLQALGNQRYLLQLSAAPEENTIYEVFISDEVQDCVGNLASESTLLRLGLPGEVEVGDVVINEILFNPVTGGVDFVEIFNCSDKILSVNGWTLANNLALTGSLRERIDAQALILPGEYLAFTPDPADILATYPDQAQAEFLIDNDLPSLPNDAGNISLLAANGDELDSFDYEEDFHSELLDDEDGVSLERINPKGATQQAGNWFRRREPGRLCYPNKD